MTAEQWACIAIAACFFLAYLLTALTAREPSPSVQAHERLRREEEWCGWCEQKGLTHCPDADPQPGALDRHIAAYRGDER